MPFVLGDDYLYALKFPENGFIGSESIEGVSDYIDSQINHYNNYNNRVLPHALLQLILLCPNVIFSILNTVAFLLLPWALLKPFITNKQKKLEYGIAYLFVLLLLWLIHYDLGRSYFWTTGAINYTWFLVLQLLYIGSLYKVVTEGKLFKTSDVFIALVICTTNENAVLSLCIVSGVLSIFQFGKNKIFDKKLFSATGILMLGGILMLLAPSLELRVINESIQFDSFGSKFIEYLKRQTYYILLMLPTLVLFFSYGVKEIKNRITVFVFISIIVISSIIMLIAPLYEPRSSIFPFVTFTMLIISMLELSSKVKLWPLFFLVGFSIIDAPQKLKDFNYARVAYNDNQERIASHTKGQTLYLKRYCHNNVSNDIACDEITTEVSVLENAILSAYLDIDSVLLEKDMSKMTYKKFSSECKSGTINLNTYKTIKFNKSLMKDVNLRAINYSENTVMIQLDNLQDVDTYTFILRGSKNQSIKEKVLQVFPNSIQQYFLFFLENDSSFEKCIDGIYAFTHIENVRDFDYILFSLYDKSNHTSVGEMIKFNIE